MEVKIIISTNGTEGDSKSPEADVVSVSRTSQGESPNEAAASGPSTDGANTTMAGIDAGPAPAAFAAPGAADGPRRFVGTAESSMPTAVGHGSDQSAGAAPAL